MIIGNRAGGIQPTLQSNLLRIASSKSSSLFVAAITTTDDPPFTRDALFILDISLSDTNIDACALSVEAVIPREVACVECNPHQGLDLSQVNQILYES